MYVLGKIEVSWKVGRRAEAKSERLLQSHDAVQSLPRKRNRLAKELLHMWQLNNLVANIKWVAFFCEGVAELFVLLLGLYMHECIAWSHKVSPDILLCYLFFKLGLLLGI